MDIITWMKKNSRAFRHAGSFLEYADKADSLLLCGEFAASLAPFYRSIGFSGPIYSYEGKDSYERSLMAVEMESVSKIEGPFSIISAPLYIQSLGTRELTSFLFDAYYALEDGGLLYISFPDAISPNVKDKELVDSFYSDGKVYMKYYSLFDVLQSVEAIGFSIQDIEMDEVDFHDRLISVALKKGGITPSCC